ncbi:MAG: hypothetical protein PGN13_12155 [Patulibacter minatonensis]
MPKFTPYPPHSPSPGLVARLRRATGFAVGACLLIPSLAVARPSDADLLRAIQAKAPSTKSVGAVSASPDGTRLAILTFATPSPRAQQHDDLWLANEDGSGLVGLQVTDGEPGLGEFQRIGGVRWSDDGQRFVYATSNQNSRPSLEAHIVGFTPEGAVLDNGLGAFTSTPRFTSDGRYVTFGWLSTAGPHGVGAVDLASGTKLSSARGWWPTGTGEWTTAYSRECARAAESDWGTPPAEPAAEDPQDWLDRALTTSPDPGCRFGANGDEPGPTPRPTPTPDAGPDPTPAPSATPTATPTPATKVDPAAAQDDAPAMTQPAKGTGLVPINERTAALGPSVRIRSTAKGLSRTVSRGLRVNLDVAGARSLKAYVIVTRPENETLFAFRGASRSITVGRLSVSSPPSQAQTISIPILRTARAPLSRFLKITVTVRIVAEDRAGNRTTVERQVPLTDF